MSVYVLKVESMLAALAAREQRVQLDADLPVVTGPLAEARRVSIVVEAGQIQACTIMNRDGRILLRGREALRVAQHFGELTWTVMRPHEASPSRETGALSLTEGSESLFPRRSVQLSAQDIETWQRRRKQVFALADGAHSLAHIAHLLSIAPSQVEQIVQELQGEGLVDW